METTFQDEFNDIDKDGDTLEFQDEVEKARVFVEASKTKFWNEYLIPRLDERIIAYDAMQQTEKDPWRRYATTEAYRVLSEFKIMLLDELEFAQKAL